MATPWLISHCVLVISLFHQGAHGLSRIVGGSDTDVSKHRYFASLYLNSIQPSDFRCGGSLVAPDVILSAAHCIKHDAPIKYAVVSSSSLFGDDLKGHLRQVINTVVHPDWEGSTLRNDLALLFLDRVVDDAESISYSRHFPVLSYLDTLSIVGMGTTADGGSFPNRLQKVDVDLIPFDVCNTAFSESGVFADRANENMPLNETTQFCAYAPGRDACHGDSGGPLIVSSTTAPDLQIGIISFGIGCALPQYPGVYTKLNAFSEWLDETICSMTRSISLSFCAPLNSMGGSGRSVVMSKKSGIIVSAFSNHGLETIGKDRMTSLTWPIPERVNTFHHLSLDDENDLLFALDRHGRNVCTYRIMKDIDNTISFQSCYKYDGQGLAAVRGWNASRLGGLSCQQGVCVHVHGHDETTLWEYDTTSGAMHAESVSSLNPSNSNSTIKKSSDPVWVISDATVINSSFVVISTYETDEIREVSPRYGMQYGTVLINLEITVRQESFLSIQDHTFPISQTVEPSRSGLVNAVHISSDGQAFLYMADGTMIIQNLQRMTHVVVLKDTYLFGKFQAVTIAIDNGIAVFGGFIPEDNRNYVMMFDLREDPMSPTPFGLLQIPDKILSIAIQDNTVAIVGHEDGVYLLTISHMTGSTLSAASQADVTVDFIPSSFSTKRRSANAGNAFSIANSRSGVLLLNRLVLLLTIWVPLFCS